MPSDSNKLSIQSVVDAESLANPKLPPEHYYEPIVVGTGILFPPFQNNGCERQARGVRLHDHDPARISSWTHLQTSGTLHTCFRVSEDG